MAAHTIHTRVVSIGAFGRHPLRPDEPSTPARPGHATTTLVRSDQALILVDPGLPASVLLPRLHERTGLHPGQITHVFLTGFGPETCRGLSAFESAQWLIGAREREAAGVPLALSLRRAVEQGEDRELIAELERQVALLRRCEPAEDRLAPRVDLFPLPGVSPGLTGLLVSEPRATVLIAGAAIASEEHLELGRVPEDAADLDAARESFAEAVEVADLIVCGRGNIAVNPTRRPF